MTITTDTDRRHLIVDSPIGALTLIATDRGLAAVYMTEHRHAPTPDSYGPAAPDDELLQRVASQLAEYFAGERQDFDLPLDPIGTPFQLRVWEALRSVDYGQTATYRDIAELLGSPTATRAVGAANGRNPISIVVPCHRVIGADGSLTGYGGGIERKRYLLTLEAGRGENALF